MAHSVRNAALTLLLAVGSHGAFAAQDNDDFVEDASAKGIAEIQAGKLAIAKGTAADVKSFAQMMIDDHTAANAKLRSLAESKKLELSDDAMLVDKAKTMILHVRDGENFDKAYANNQVVAHEKTIELFQKEVKEGKDADLKKFASDTLPKLEDHLKQAKELAAAHGGDAAKK